MLKITGILILEVDRLPLIDILKSVLKYLLEALTFTLESTFLEIGTLKLLYKDGYTEQDDINVTNDNKNNNFFI